MMLGNKRAVKESESLELLRYAAVRSKDQLTEIYLKNKAKLPPILQSREFLLHQLNNPSPKVPSARQQFPLPEDSADIVGNYSTEIIPRMGKILFDKDNPRKIRRDYLVYFTEHHKGEPYKIRQIDATKKDQKTKIFSKINTCPSELTGQYQGTMNGSKAKRMVIKTQHFQMQPETQRALQRSRSINIKEILQNFSRLKVQRQGQRLQLKELGQLKKSKKKTQKKKRMRIISSIPLQPEESHIIEQQIYYQEIEPWSHSKDEDQILFR